MSGAYSVIASQVSKRRKDTVELFIFGAVFQAFPCATFRLAQGVARTDGEVSVRRVCKIGTSERADGVAIVAV